MQSEKDIEYMRRALSLAEAAVTCDEVPIGAVIVHRGEIIAEAHNERETMKDATRHAEIVAIERACKALGGWRLPDCTLYVTVEPCVMCAGAIINARIDRVVFGTYDVRAGAFGSVVDVNGLGLNHKVQIDAPCMCDECKSIMSAYFKEKRKK